MSIPGFCNSDSYLFLTTGIFTGNQTKIVCLESKEVL